MSAQTPVVASTASAFLRFVNASPSPFHAVSEVIKMLNHAGFVELNEREPWETRLAPMGKYFTVRNQSALIAFVVGKQFRPGNGFSIVGAHTDSPCLKVKPKSKKEKAQFSLVGVETYGGGLWHTWFDRDLSLAGRVFVEQEDGSIKSEMPLLRIPTLAIHLDRSVNDGFQFNKETHLNPVISLANASLNQKDESSAHKHSSALISVLSKELGVDPSRIMDFELCLYDTQDGKLGGANDEFVFAARLDNLCMSYCAIEALIASCRDTTSLEKDETVRSVALFDNEEVGSLTSHGADSNFLVTVLERITNGYHATGFTDPTADLFERAMPKSFFISADMAHACHPNYMEKHEENHRPVMGQGIVIKQNANQRYATTSLTSMVVKQIAKKRSLPFQEFVVRNDSPCGSTIGPMLSGKLGLRTIDVGVAQLSMHSIREQCAAADLPLAIDLFEEFFKSYQEIDKKVHL